MITKDWSDHTLRESWNFDMEGDAETVERCCESDKMTLSQLGQVCIDDHHMHLEEFEAIGELAPEARRFTSNACTWPVLFALACYGRSTLRLGLKQTLDQRLQLVLYGIRG